MALAMVAVVGVLPSVRNKPSAVPRARVGTDRLAPVPLLATVPLATVRALPAAPLTATLAPRMSTALTGSLAVRAVLAVTSTLSVLALPPLVDRVWYVVRA